MIIRNLQTGRAKRNIFLFNEQRGNNKKKCFIKDSFCIYSPSITVPDKAEDAIELLEIRKG